MSSLTVRVTPGLLKALAILSYTSAGKSAIELQDKKNISVFKVILKPVI